MRACHGREVTEHSSYLHLFFKTGATSFDYFLLAVGILAAIAAGVPFPLLGILFGQLVDDLNSAACSTSQDKKSSLQSHVEPKVILMVYIAIANFVAMYIHTGCWSLVGERLVRRLRERYFCSLLRQEVSYFDNLPAGEVSARLTSDIELVRTGTSEKVGICISSFSYFAGAYIVAFIKDAKLAGMLVSLIPAYLLMATVGGKYVSRYTGHMSDHVAAATSIASESLANVAVVQAFGASARLEVKFAEHLRSAQIQGLKKAFSAAVQFGLMFFIAYSANALAFWQGSRTIARSIIRNDTSSTVGDVYTVIFLLIDGM